MKTLKTLKAELLKHPDTRAEYEALADEFALARELIAARTSERPAHHLETPAGPAPD